MPSAVSKVIDFFFHFSLSLSGELVDEEKYVKIADGLLIKRVYKNDSGEYTCKAFQISSAISNVKEQTIRLNIQRKCNE